MPFTSGKFINNNSIKVLLTSPKKISLSPGETYEGVIEQYYLDIRAVSRCVDKPKKVKVETPVDPPQDPVVKTEKAPVDPPKVVKPKDEVKKPAVAIKKDSKKDNKKVGK